jgi:DNA polymerase-3 subunit alpha
LEDILKDTYGINIYQEETLEIAKKIGGFTLSEADVLRKSVGKKIPSLMAECRKLFIEKAEKVGIVTKEEAVDIFNGIEKSNRYAFNHCTSFDTFICRNRGKNNKFSLTVEDIQDIMI